MAKAAARFLRGKDFPALGLPRPLERIGPLLDLLPPLVRERLYTAAASYAAFPPEELDRVRSDDLASWAAGLFPTERSFPAVILGSPNGAAVHLSAALGAPYLPQTFLLPVAQRGGHIDDVIRRAEGAVPGAGRMLAHNPHLQVHQLHDPVNDRPQLVYFDYFRIKLLRIEPAYRRFITRTLQPGGTLLVVESGETWPTTRLQERHFFQMGGVGGVRLDEYFRGGERVERFLASRGSHRRRWEVPEPDGERPEAEWGFDPQWSADLDGLAREGGYRVVRLVLGEAGDLGSTVADLYRWWYRRRGLPDGRLLAECFFLLDPWWALRLGAVPYWMVFNTMRSVEALSTYVESREPFDEIGLMLLSNAVDAIGGASVDRCRDLLGRARKEGRFIGTDAREFPRDMAVMARYRPALEAWTTDRRPMPDPLTVDEVAAFFGGRGDERVRWIG